jgi:mRNA interferase RelE/StbE
VTHSPEIKGSAAKALSKIANTDRHRLIEAIDRLRRELSAGGVLKGEFSGLRGLHVGTYRVVYEVVADELVILGVRVGHRKDVYREK